MQCNTYAEAAATVTANDEDGCRNADEVDETVEQQRKRQKLEDNTTFFQVSFFLHESLVGNGW